MFRFTRTIDEILKSVTRGISDLRAIGEEHLKEEAAKIELANRLEEEADAHGSEAECAFTLAERFEKLITVEPEPDAEFAPTYEENNLVP